MTTKPRDNREYRDLSQALRRKAKRANLPCWICGKPIDWNADWRHPLSYTYDHTNPVAGGGHMRGAGRPAHRQPAAATAAAEPPHGYSHHPPTHGNGESANRGYPQNRGVEQGSCEPGCRTGVPG